MIDMDKWANTTSSGKFEFVESLLTISNTTCISKDDWEIMCNFLLDEIHTSRHTIADLIETIREKEQTIRDLQSTQSSKDIPF